MYPFLRIFTLIACLNFSAFSQEVAGSWTGKLSVPGGSLTLVFNIEKNGEQYHATMDSPDQGAKGLEASSAIFSDGKLLVDMSNFGIRYEGVLENDSSLTGTFKQGGMQLPLNLKRGGEKPRPRPQTPAQPYPYYSEEVSFSNDAAGIKLSGTLTRPEKPGRYPAIILVSGSGPQNRNSAIMGHEPFLVLSDYFTRAGYAVLRYDDRGVGASEGKFQGATSADFATDAAAAFEFLQQRADIDTKKIGFAGHSEGGLIAPMVAANNKDVSFLILMAGPSQSGAEILLEQKELIGKAQGVPEEELREGLAINRELFNIISNNDPETKQQQQIKEVLARSYQASDSIKAASPEGQREIEVQLAALSDPWWRYFIRYHPKETLKQVRCPVLAINGTKDLQVPCEANLEAIKKYVKECGNKKVTTIALPGLNHLFQQCTTGDVAEYSEIEQTFAPEAMETMLHWLQRLK